MGRTDRYGSRGYDFQMAARPARIRHVDRPVSVALPARDRPRTPARTLAPPA